MLWVVVLASILGFLAVMPMANLEQIVKDKQDFSQFSQLSQLSQLLDLLNHQNSQQILTSISITTATSSVILVLLVWWLKRLARKGLMFGSQVWFTGICHILVFFLVLLSSVCYGMKAYLYYQDALLKQPLTVNATIVSQQISDSVNIPLPSLDDKQHSMSFGSLYPRQIWQIKQINLPENDSEHIPVRTPMTVMVMANLTKNPQWQPILNQLQPNQTLNVTLALQPITQTTYDNLPNHATPLNIGFDQAMWLRQRGVQAMGEITEIDKNSLSNNKFSDTNDRTQPNFSKQLHLIVEKWRWQFRQNLIAHFTQAVDKQPLFSHDNILAQADSHAILLGLLTGDKAMMSSELKHRYQVTGISHLLAISGPHVTLLASIVAVLVLLLIKSYYPKLLLRMPSQLIVLWISVAVAGVYALLVGFELPAQRTFYMLLIVTLATQFLIVMNTYRLLAIVGLVMMWLDPTAVMQAGFWLSFVAVGLLLKFSQTNFVQADELTFSQVFDEDNHSKIGMIFRLIYQQTIGLLKLQLWLFIFMMPIVVWFFGKLSLIGILVNLVAVPLLGLVIVPLDMVAGLLSQIPVLSIIGDGIWSILATLLQLFHAMLTWLIDSGMAKQAFLSVTQSQLLVITLAILLMFMRGILPRMAVLPLLMAFLSVGFMKNQATQQIPILAISDNTKITIALLKKGNENWLVLADNQNLDKTPKAKKFEKTPQKTLQTISQTNKSVEFNDEILSLLAQYHVDKLTGIISQTPSLAVNDSIQNLAKTLPIEQYWLAGFDPLQVAPHQANWQFEKLTPKSCQFNQTWQSDDNQLTITAISGWQLDLPNEQINQEERLATQTCDLQITTGNKKTYQAVITAGRSNLPLAMSMKLCNVTHTNLFISPYQTPLDKDWLAQAQPNILHMLTGTYQNEILSDSSQFTLADLSTVYQPQMVFAHQVGSMAYQLKY